LKPEEPHSRRGRAGSDEEQSGTERKEIATICTKFGPSASGNDVSLPPCGTGEGHTGGEEPTAGLEELPRFEFEQ